MKKNDFCETILYDVWIISQSTALEETERKYRRTPKFFQTCKRIANSVLSTLHIPFHLNWGPGLHGVIPFALQEFMNIYPGYQLVNVLTTNTCVCLRTIVYNIFPL
jgi:hypothetical protein